MELGLSPAAELLCGLLPAFSSSPPDLDAMYAYHVRMLCARLQCLFAIFSCALENSLHKACALVALRCHKMTG